MTSQGDATRDRVAEAYAQSITKSEGCCRGAPADERHIVSKLAGYSAAELAALPADAVVNSFGCGNPVALAELAEGDVVLDLGSGAGIDLLLAAKRVGPSGRIIGVDMTDEMIARAESNIAASGLDNIELRKGIIEELPVDSEAVDWVISNCVINLSPEKPRVFAEIARVLRPGGRLSVSDVVAEDLPDWVRDNPDLYNSCLGGAISEEAYLKGLREAGLTDATVADRLVYEESQIADFLLSEEGAASCGCGCGGVLNQRLAQVLAGKVSSARFTASKPKA